MVTPRLWSTASTAIAALIFLALAGGAQVAARLTVTNTQFNADVRQILPLEPPSTASIKLLSAGRYRAASDTVWLNTIQYFGGGNPNEPYSALPALLRTVIELDPDFEYPYLFAGLVLPWQQNSTEALAILNRGLAKFPRNGLMAYYAGAIARIQLNDNVLAAKYFRLASTLPGAPRAAALLAGVSLTEADDRQIALAWWNGLIETTNDEATKERAVLWRDHLALILTLETKVLELREQGLAVNSMNDLAQLIGLPKVPESPLGLPLRLDVQTGRIDLLRD